MIYRRGRKVKSLIKEKESGRIWEDSQVGKVGYGDHRSPASLFRFAQNDRRVPGMAGRVLRIAGRGLSIAGS